MPPAPAMPATRSSSTTHAVAGRGRCPSSVGAHLPAQQPRQPVASRAPSARPRQSRSPPTARHRSRPRAGCCPPARPHRPATRDVRNRASPSVALASIPDGRPRAKALPARPVLALRVSRAIVAAGGLVRPQCRPARAGPYAASSSRDCLRSAGSGGRCASASSGRHARARRARSPPQAGPRRRGVGTGGMRARRNPPRHAVADLGDLERPVALPGQRNGVARLRAPPAMAAASNSSVSRRALADRAACARPPAAPRRIEHQRRVLVRRSAALRARIAVTVPVR